MRFPWTGGSIQAIKALYRAVGGEPHKYVDIGTIGAELRDALQQLTENGFIIVNGKTVCLTEDGVVAVETLQRPTQRSF